MNNQNRDIYGVILAAGVGERLRPLSFHLPKPLLPICNKPILQHQIEFMKEIGISQFRIVVGHLGRHIMEAFGDGSDLGVSIRYVIQEKPLGIAHAVYQLEEELDGPFLLFLGDIFMVPSELKKMTAIFRQRKAAGVLAVMKEDRPKYIQRNFAVVLGKDEQVVKVIEKPRYVRDTLKGCGVYLFDLPIFDAIRRTPRTAMRDEYEITTSIQMLIDDELPVYPAEVVEWDMNVTLPCDLLDCNVRLLDYFAWDNLIGDNVDIPPQAQVIKSVIGDNVTVKHPIKISKSLLMADTIVKADRDLHEVIVFGDNIIQCSLDNRK